MSHRFDLLLITGLLWGGFGVGALLMPLWFWAIPGLLTLGFSLWLVGSTHSKPCWRISSILVPIPRWCWPAIGLAAVALLILSRVYPIGMRDLIGPMLIAAGSSHLVAITSNNDRLDRRDRIPIWILSLIIIGIFLVIIAAFAAVATPFTVVFSFALWLFTLQLFLIVPLALYHFMLEQETRSSLTVAEPYPAVTMLIPAYNEADTIAATLEAAIHSAYPDEHLDIIVIDDGSTDDTYAIAAGYRDRGVQVYHRPNGGKHAALNLGLACSEGDIVVTVDADSRVDEGAITEMVAQLQQTPSLGCVGGTVRVDNTGHPLTDLQALEYAFDINTSRRAFSQLDVVPIMPGCMSAFKREALRNIGGFSPDTVAEDFDVTIQLLKHGWKTRHSSAIVWTTAPRTVGGLWTQRVRWYLGGLQTMWKHRDVFFTPDTRYLHAFSLPLRGVSQLFVPVGSFLILSAIIVALLVGDTGFVLLMGGFFLTLTCLLMALAVRIEGEKLSLLAYAPMMFVGYKHFLDLSMGMGILQSIRIPNARTVDPVLDPEMQESRWEMIGKESPLRRPEK